MNTAVEEWAQCTWRAIRCLTATSRSRILSPNKVNAESSSGSDAKQEWWPNLNHPGIVAVHDIGRHEGSLFFVMAYVQGASLAVVSR